MSVPKPGSARTAGIVKVARGWGAVRGHSASQPSRGDSTKHCWNGLALRCVLRPNHPSHLSFLQPHPRDERCDHLQMEIVTQVLTHLASIALQPRWGLGPLPAPPRAWGGGTSLRH